jgi:hypothetical protein
VFAKKSKFIFLHTLPIGHDALKKPFNSFSQTGFDATISKMFSPNNLAKILAFMSHNAEKVCM